MNSNQLPLDSQQLSQFVLQLQQQFFALQEQVQQHHNILEKMDKLEKENLELNEKILRLSHENQKLRDRLSVSPSDPENLSSPAFEPTTQGTDQSSWAKITQKNSAQPTKPKVAPGRSLKKRQAASRVCRSPSEQGPQGYAYVYFGRSRKIQRSEVRSRLRHVGVDTGRIIDVCFPASGKIGVLLHTQYVEEFKAIMATTGAQIFTSFDPMSPANLADPKFASWTEEQRGQKIHELVRDRCRNTLAYLRPLTVNSVGRFFVDEGRMDESDLQEALANARERLAREDPRKAAFLFRSSQASNPCCAGKRLTNI